MATKTSKLILLLFLTLVVIVIILVTLLPREEAPPLLPSTDTLAIPADSAGMRRDISMVVHEFAVNNLLDAIGELKGDGTFLVSSALTRFEWNVTQPRVHISEGKAVFTATVHVKALGSEYDMQSSGGADIEYVEADRQLNLLLDSAPIDIRLNLFGQEIKVGTVDAATLISPIKLLGPLDLYTDFKVKKQHEKIMVNFAITDHQVSYKDKHVVVDFEVDFKESNKPFPADSLN